jgi:hypothetical protein
MNRSSLSIVFSVLVIIVVVNVPLAYAVVNLNKKSQWIREQKFTCIDKKITRVEYPV